MGLRRVVVVLVREDRHDVGFGAILLKVLRERASSCVVEFVTEHQNATPPKADLE